MSFLQIKLLSLALTLACLAALASARGLPASDLPALEGGVGLPDCWNALLELRSCTNEIVLFFLNGESHLGLDCCRAIRVITHRCWPSMLASLGFTTQEGDILRGYCDAGTAAPPPSPSPHAALPPPPAIAPSGSVADLSDRVRVTLMRRSLN